MSRLSVIRYLSDYDMRRFLFYFIMHPFKAVEKRETDRFPIYLPQALFDPEKQIEPANKIDVKPVQTEDTIFFCGEDHKTAETVWRIHLAGVDMEVDIEKIDWNMVFDDPEDMSAYHRFIWLYTGLIRRRSEKCDVRLNERNVIELIRSWIVSFPILKKEEFHFEIWHPYAVAERIVNWLYSLAAVSSGTVEDKLIVQSIQQQLEYVCKNLEYHGERFTCNHLCNNGKALYVGGMFMGLKEYADIGRRILLEEAARIIIDEGFLREGSIHYQFLITKQYTDAFWIAKSFGDTEFVNKLEPWLRKMINGCVYFLVKRNDGQWDIPRIGDCSPDFQPEWIIGTPWVAKYLLDGTTFADIPKHVGYHSFFRMADVKKNEKEDILNIKKNTKGQRDWIYVENINFLLYAHVNRSMYPNNLAGHFHQDTGSFVLYYKDQCVFVDCGRFTYEMNKEGNRGKGISGHNLLNIDGIAPDLNMRSFFSKQFLDKAMGNNPEILYLDGNTIEIDINGYRRVKKVQEVKRRIQLLEESIVITDSIKGSGRHKIRILYHTFWDVRRVSEKEIMMESDKLKFSLCFSETADKLEIKNGNEDEVYGHYSAEYGKDRHIHTIIFEKILLFPSVIGTVFQKVEESYDEDICDYTNV